MAFGDRPPMQDGDHRPRGAVRAAGAGHAQGGRRPLQDRPLRRLHAQTAGQNRTHAIEYSHGRTEDVWSSWTGTGNPGYVKQSLEFTEPNHHTAFG